MARLFMVAVPVATAYLDALSWGTLPLLGYFGLRYLCEGMSWTLPAMLVAFLGLLLKIPLNYAFIYGAGPIPALGGAGSGTGGAKWWWWREGWWWWKARKIHACCANARGAF